jgi:diacylglycerol kinase family enzyme
MFILLNRHSNNGRGHRRWEESKSELEAGLLGRDYRLAEDCGGLGLRLGEEYGRGERLFIAAGGDGTVNFLLNKIMTAEGIIPGEITLGAIGLGSSNDFHKPYSAGKRTRAGVYYRLDADGAVPHNIGQVDYEDETGRPLRKYFIINGSLGIIARGNYLFNSDGRVVRWLKPRWVLGTIWYLTFRTLLTEKNIPVRISVGGNSLQTEATTLSVIINPHFTGNLSYDCGDFSRRDGFGIALCENMGTAERFRTLSSLSKGRFTGLRKTRFWESPEVELDPRFPTPLELDGEVVLARRIQIRLLKGAVKVCQ